MMVNGPCLIGIDVGTTSCKATIFDLRGHQLAIVAEEYPIHTPCAGWAEQDPNMWTEAAFTALRTVIKKVRIYPSDIAAIGLTGQQSSIVLIDADGHILHPSILWMDRRTVPQCDFVKRRVGEDVIYNKTGLRIDPIYSLSKLLWIKEHFPRIFNNIHKMLLPKDYLAYRLTGNKYIDYANAASTQLLDIGKLQWCDDVLELLDIPSDILPTLCSPTDVVGELTEQLARKVGLRKGIPVVSGGGDTTVSALGTGVSVSKSAAIILGTASDVVICMDRLILDPQKRVGYYPHVIPHKYIAIAGANTSGVAFRWFRDQFYKAEMKTAESLKINTYKLMDEEAVNIKPGSEGMLFLPYLLGERSPIWNPIARGLFFGITLRHTRAHFVQAIMEGIAFSIKHRIEVAEELGLPVFDLVFSGGGAKSQSWSQILANVLGKPIVVPVIEETTCLGSALLAGLGIGIYHDAVALRGMVLKNAITYNPHLEHYDNYERLFSVYKELYECTAHLLPIVENT
jgi:xylulokinase